MNGLSILRNWYRSLLTIVVWVSLAAAPGAAWAQQSFELEGKINGIDAGARTITVMDIVVHVPEGLSIDTPTGSIPLSGPGSLSDPALPSLVGVATAIITGMSKAQAAGAKTLLFRCDVSDDARVRAMLAATEKEFGRLDALINNAGTTIDIDSACDSTDAESSPESA